MMLNSSGSSSKIPLPQRSISTSGLDFERSAAATTNNRHFQFHPRTTTPGGGKSSPLRSHSKTLSEVNTSSCSRSKVRKSYSNSSSLATELTPTKSRIPIPAAGGAPSSNNQNNNTNNNNYYYSSTSSLQDGQPHSGSSSSSSSNSSSNSSSLSSSPVKRAHQHQQQQQQQQQSSTPLSPSKIPLPVTTSNPSLLPSDSSSFLPPLPCPSPPPGNRVMRKYETFVMTGERMLCITKTPAKVPSPPNQKQKQSEREGGGDRVDGPLSKRRHNASLPLNGEASSSSSFEKEEDIDISIQGGPVAHSPEHPFQPLTHSPLLNHHDDDQEEDHNDESISPSTSPVDRLADLNESISSSSSSETDGHPSSTNQLVGDETSLRSPSMIPFHPASSPGGGGGGDPAVVSEGESDLESLHSYHPPPKIVDIPSAIRLAKRLYHLDGFRKSDVSRHLSRNNEYNQVVAEEYLKFFDFSNLTLDGALRLFLSQFCLTGETQERERVLFYFSKRYRECNPDTKSKFLSSDAIHTLTCAIMLLNTDLHGDSGQRKMTSGEFIKNLSGLNEGQDFPRELLKSLYYAIKHEPIPWALNNPVLEHPKDLGGARSGEALSETSHEEMRVGGLYYAKDPKELPPPSQLSSSSSSREGFEDGSELMTGPRNTIHSSSSHLLPKPINLGSGVNPFLALPDPMSSTDYKKGYVMRKCCVDPNGKRTKMGRRSWKMFYLSLRDMVLYCFKDEKSLRAPGAFEDLNQAIRIHHGLALRASDYTKKQFVFRLHTCDMAEYLFQTSDEKELLTWIDAINYVVASFSSPKLPAPISSASTARFQRPLLPSSKSKLSPGEQLHENESSLSELRRELDEHFANPPPKNASSAQHHFYKDKQDYLNFEVQRYETYILTLRTKFTSEQQAQLGQQQHHIGGETLLSMDHKAKSLERIY